MSVSRRQLAMLLSALAPATAQQQGALPTRVYKWEDLPVRDRGENRQRAILDGKTGILHLVKADPSSYTELAAANMVKENDMAWAPLALADGRLLVRDWTTLKCVDLKK